MRIAVRSLLFIALMAQVFVEPAGGAPHSDAESIFGPTDIAAIAGNGRLTIAVNRSGRLTNCRWPSPGYYEHIAYTTQSRSEPLLGVEPRHGASWALQVGDQLVWIHDDRWSHRLLPAHSSEIIEIESVLDERDLRVYQQFSVSSEGNGYTAHITVNGDLDGAPSVYWYANYTPSTRLIPYFPITLNGTDDFASFVDPNLGAVCHFRPEDPSSNMWRAARRLVGNDHEIDAWKTFPKGSYVVYGSGEGVKGITVGPDQGPASVANQVSAGSLSDQHSATGQIASAIALELSPKNEGYTATIFTTFGTNYEEAAQRYIELRDERGSAVRESTDRAESDYEHVMRLAMLTIHTCTDAETGSVVRSPTNTPPLAIDWPRYGVWIALAHDTAGDRESARRLLRFYAAQVRTRPSGDVPIGSLPAALYTNGVEAAPNAIVDAAAAGRVLWAIGHHGMRLNVEQRNGFYRSVWEPVSAITDFLVQWSEPGGNGPLYTFDYKTLRDRRTTELFAASHLGLVAANRIAIVLREERPEWQRASSEFSDALRLHAIQTDDAVTVANPGMLHDTGMIRDTVRYDWPTAIQKFVRNAGDRLDTVTLEHLCKLVLSARDISEPLRSDITARLKRHLNRESPDAADAAFAYLVAQRLMSIEQNPPTPIQELLP